MGTTTVRSDIEKGTEAAFTTYLGDRDIKVTATVQDAITAAVTRWFNQHETQVLGSLAHQPGTAEQQLAEINAVLRTVGIDATGAAGVIALAALVQYAETTQTLINA
jgi:hypothetical protein